MYLSTLTLLRFYPWYVLIRTFDQTKVPLTNLDGSLPGWCQIVTERCEVWTTHLASLTVKEMRKPFAPIVAGIQSIRVLLIITGFGGYLLEELNTMLSTSAILKSR